jgi:hypothetical protein
MHGFSISNPPHLEFFSFIPGQKIIFSLSKIGTQILRFGIEKSSGTAFLVKQGFAASTRPFSVGPSLIHMTQPS